MRALLGRVRWRRLVAASLGVVAIVAVSYLVVANVLLRTRLLRNAVSGSSLNFAIRGNTTALLLDYESAYSIFPGRVHVEGLRIRGRERTLEWLLTLDRGDASISLVDLFRRSFHATRVRGSGFAIRLRPRLDPATATPEVIAALPSIPGFADPPLLDRGPAPPLLTDADYDLWKIELEDVDVEHVREVWIQTWRSKGDTHLRGRLLFRPQRGLEVGPATVDANGIDFFYGKRILATGLRGSLEATLHPFDLRQTKGLAIFDQVSYDGKLRGRAIIAEVLRTLGKGIDFKRCEGPLDARIVLDHGKLAHGTHISSEAGDCELETQGLTIRAPVRTELGVDRGLGTIETRLTGLRVSLLGVEQARAASVVATLKSRRLELARAFGDTLFALEVHGAETNDLGAFRRFLPPASSFVIRSGKVTADVHVDGSLVEGGGWAKGSAEVAADAMTVRLGRGILVSKLAAHVELRRGTLETRTFDFSGSSVALRNVTAKSESGGGEIFVAPSLTANASRLVLGPSGEDVIASVDLPRAELLDLGRLRELLSLPTGLRIDAGRGEAKLHADIELPSGSMQGDAEVALRGIRARIGSTKLFGDLRGSLKARRSEGSEGSTVFSGIKLAITRAGTGSARSSDQAWWGNLVLSDATLRNGAAGRFDASAHLSAKDATIATVLVSENTAVPSWAIEAFQMPLLDANAKVTVLPQSFEMRSLVARGGSSSVRAEYAKKNGSQNGAVLVDLGFIHLGYDLSDGTTGLVLLDSEGWFGRKTATMRNAAGTAKEKSDGAEQLAR